MSAPILEIRNITKRFGIFRSELAMGFARDFVEAPARFNAARTSEAQSELPAFLAGIDTALQLPNPENNRRTSRAEIL